jgi:hypothetical protein
MSTQQRRTLSPSSAYRFVVIIGITSLFADMTYEGARSITGPFLQMLRARLQDLSATGPDAIG